MIPRSLLWCMITGLAAAPSAAASGPGSAWGTAPVGHKDLVAEHSALVLPPQQRPTVVPGAHLLAAAAPSGPAVSREVWGYLPYWSYRADAPYIPARWDLLTVMMWFGLSMDGEGAITDWNGWGGPTTQALVDEAHRHGVKLVVTVTNFNNESIAALVNSPERRARAIENLVQALAVHGADGINVDFEFVPKEAKQGFVVFMADLKQAVAAVAPNGAPGHVSLAGPSVDWHGAYDYDALLEATDGIMVMAYGYYWSGGNPGPTSPLHGGSPWTNHSVAWTIDDYLTWGGAHNRHKVIIGLPWYGRRWQVPNQDIPTTGMGSGKTLVYHHAEDEVDVHGRGFEAHTRSTYYHKDVDGALNQCWFDDGRSFGEKVAYIDEMDLGGLGIWALGYEGDYEDLWDAIDAAFVPEDEPPVVEADGDGGDVVESDVVESDTAPGADTAPGSDTGISQDPPPGVAVGPTVQRPRRDALSRQVVADGCATGPLAPWWALCALWGGLGVLRRRRP